MWTQSDRTKTSVSAPVSPVEVHAQSIITGRGGRASLHYNYGPFTSCKLSETVPQSFASGLITFDCPDVVLKCAV